MKLKLSILTLSIGMFILSCSSEKSEPESKDQKSNTAEANKCDLCFHISRVLAFNDHIKRFEDKGELESAKAYRDSLTPSMDWLQKNSGLEISAPSELQTESMESACASCLASYGINLNSPDVHQQLLKLAEWTRKKWRVINPEDYLNEFEADQTLDSLNIHNGRVVSRENFMLHYDTLYAEAATALDLIQLRVDEAVDTLLNVENNNYSSRFILTQYALLHYNELEEKVGWDWYDGTRWKSIERKLTNLWAEVTSD